ncbi:MAG: diguanylate cyclase [Bacteroidetes bacterium]|nr:diguanylate cyclase [Bacteroidota bacterium]MBU1423131.1 diguanylate cyclase [Bacteroidota bacterium]
MKNKLPHLFWDKIITSIRSIDGIILLVGVAGIFIALFTDSSSIRFIFLIIVLIASSLVFLSIISKQNEIKKGFIDAEIKTDLNSVVQTVEEESNMKKLVFDDLQLENGGKYVVKEVRDEKVIREDEIVKTALPQKPVIKPETKPLMKDFQISDFFDVDTDLYKSATEPHTEFDFLLNKVLSVIKDVIFAHTVAFFWVNSEKQQLVCEAKITNSYNFSPDRRLPMQHDIVSKIARQSKPEIITRVNPVSERELIIYYTEPQFIKSFVGVPVFFQGITAEKTTQEAVAVIAIDSKTEESFGAETLLLLGQFTKLISGLIKNYTDKYDLLLDAELLNSIHRFHEKIRNDLSISTISQSLVDESSKLLKWDFISIVLQDETKKMWTVKKVINRTGEIYVRPKTTIDFNESIVGQVIKKNSHELIEDFETQRQIRFFVGEKVDYTGSFVSVPISSMNKCFGALNAESKDKYNFSKQDIEVLYRLAENAAAALEIFFMNEIIKEYVIVDDLTGVYSRKFWFEKFSDELCRADDFGEDLSLLFLNVDNAPELLIRYGQDGVSKMLITLSKIIRCSVRPYDLVGRLENNRFGIVLVKTPANEAYLWAEKIRKTFAGVIIEVDGKSFSITISIGVCGAIEGITKDELIKNTSMVLQKSIESGGNTVRVF